MLNILIYLSFIAALNGLASANCTPAQRINYASQIPHAYNLSPLAASAVAFEAISFAADCQTSIAPNGATAIPVTVNGNTTTLFAIATRQLFSDVTGKYIDFPNNGTMDIQTNVTLGIRDIIPIPITFFANVYLDFDAKCEIKAVRAFAKIPTVVLDLILNPPGIPVGTLPSDLISELLGIVRIHAFVMGD